MSDAEIRAAAYDLILQGVPPAEAERRATLALRYKGGETAPATQAELDAMSVAELLDYVRTFGPEVLTTEREPEAAFSEEAMAQAAEQTLNSLQSKREAAEAQRASDAKDTLARYKANAKVGAAVTPLPDIRDVMQQFDLTEETAAAVIRGEA